MTDPEPLAAGLSRLAGTLVKGASAAAGLKRLSGGASQETWSFDVAGEGFILRRAPGGVENRESAQAIGLATEAAVIEAARAAGAPAPRVAHVCRAEDGLGAAYIMERLAGETIARKIQRDAPFEPARARFARDCGAALAKIHRCRLPASIALPVSQAREQLDRYEDIYRSFETPRPMFDLAFAELRRMAPAPEAPVLLHGDFRLGNLMIAPQGLVAALDWELAHLGDPAEDMGWICTPSWRFGQVERPVGGIGAVADLISGYRDAGGDDTVTAERVRFWTIFGALKWGIMCLTMYRAFEMGADASVERAAIGRRSSETELDLALLFKGLMQ